jgi:hypothetical protein
MADDIMPAVFDMALGRFVELQRERVVKMFNRDRARFAEVLVAVLLGEGAAVAVSPNAAWDVTYTPSPDTRPLRLEVKCSGAYLPSKVIANPSYRASPAWELPVNKVGTQDADFKSLEKGRHRDVLVLARHEADVLELGWYFRVLPSELVPTVVTRKTFHRGTRGGARCSEARAQAPSSRRA